MSRDDSIRTKKELRSRFESDIYYCTPEMRDFAIEVVTEIVNKYRRQDFIERLKTKGGEDGSRS